MNAAGADEVILALEQAGVLREVDDEEDYPAAAARRGAGRSIRRCSQNPLRKLRKSPSLPTDAAAERRRHDCAASSPLRGPEALPNRGRNRSRFRSGMWPK